MLLICLLAPASPGLSVGAEGENPQPAGTPELSAEDRELIEYLELLEQLDLLEEWDPAEAPPPSELSARPRRDGGTQ